MGEEFITVVETRAFELKAKKLLSSHERSELISLLAQKPMCGEILVGTGGIRKVRIGIEGRGKSGGARVVYYYHDSTFPLFLLTVFAKNEKDNLTKAERNDLAKFVKILIDSYRG